MTSCVTAHQFVLKLFCAIVSGVAKVRARNRLLARSRNMQRGTTSRLLTRCHVLKHTLQLVSKTFRQLSGAIRCTKPIRWHSLVGVRQNLRRWEVKTLHHLNKTDRAYLAVFHEHRSDNIVRVTHSTRGRNISAV